MTMQELVGFSTKHALKLSDSDNNAFVRLSYKPSHAEKIASSFFPINKIESEVQNFMESLAKITQGKKSTLFIFYLFLLF